jgi:CrcB protein
MAEQAVLVLVTALAGGVGAVLRFVLDGAITARFARSVSGVVFPWGIWAVNLSGSFLIGLLSAVVVSSHPSAVMLGVGLLGGYTTFSAASFDTVQLLRRGRVVAAFGNGLGQLVAAVFAALLGFFLGQLIGAV